MSGISSSIFAKCHNLTTIDVDQGNSNYFSINGMLFSGAANNASLIGFPSAEGVVDLSSIAGVTITAIDRGAFEGNMDITDISFPVSLTRIGVNAFKGCKNFTTVVIPSGVTTIGEQAFSITGSSSFKDVYVPSSVTSIGDSAFYHVYNNASEKLNVHYAGSSAEWTDNVSKGRTPTYGCNMIYNSTP